ncbi:MAG: mandelate racemase/muconate lactonizing enzyme family protein [Deltaproteobacteria bacterium]|nr:mandelate racemase/muconate lactonizing enzyme family protein [Planctomycetota bacterium]MBI2534103.1 mandelate racemase/muconate lactonizing enzyme family protein [Deltaproteobacteria bacterium]
MNIQQISWTRVRIPYAPPLGPYTGRRGDATAASPLIVRVTTDAGLVGWGEGQGNFTLDPNTVLAGVSVTGIESAVVQMEKAGLQAGPISGVEMALWDLLGKKAGLPLCELWGGRLRDVVDFCACMGLKKPGDSAATAREYVERWGFRFLKTKAGREVEEDIQIAEAIQKAVGHSAVLRPDANSGHSVERAEKLLRAVKSLGVECFEDPCPAEDPRILARFRREIGVRLFLNMPIGNPQSVLPILSAGAADMLMPDTPAAGGLWRVKKVAITAEAWGVPCMMHCSHDLGLKTAAVLHMAASTPNFSGPNDTCYHGLTDDVLAKPFEFQGGTLRVPQGPGLGVQVDEDRLRRYQVPS